MKNFLKVGLILLSFSAYSVDFDLCHPEVSQNDDNYIIGYGSLMQKESREITHPNAKDVYPVEVRGFKRVWGIQGKNYRTTFLTLIEDKNASLNAVYYPAADYDILEADEREMGYCRMLVPKDNIEPLGLKDMPDGVYWIYVKEGNKISPASKEYPIVQSYVDIFLNGCIEIGRTYRLPNFLERCITESYGWPTDNDSWVNDRHFPRRPFKTTNAFYIDEMLTKYFPNYHQHPID